MRTFTRRRQDRIERLRDRAQFLAGRIVRVDRTEGAKKHDRQEFSALMWALEEIARMDQVEDIIHDGGVSGVERLIGIEGICESRWRPTDEDLERAPALARQYVDDEQESPDDGIR